MSSIPVIDLIFLILIVLMLIHGYVKGFVEEFFSWAIPVLAIWVAVLLYPAGAALIRQKIMEKVRFVPEVLAFIIIFLIVMLFLKMLEKVLTDVITGAKLGGANKVLGLIFGLIEGITLTVLILFVLAIQPLFDASKIIDGSIFADILLPFIRIPLEKGKDIVKTALLIKTGIWFPV